MLKKNLLSLIVVAILLTACGSSYAYEEAAAPMLDMASGDYGGGYAVESEAMYADDFSSGSRLADGSANATIERMVIKNAHLSIVVTKPSTAMDEIMSMAEEMGGHVVSSNLWETTSYNNKKVLQASVTVRVPSDRLDEALAIIKAGAGQVTSESVSGEDVTSQYTDLSSRLRNLESAEEQLAKIMDNASTTEEVLQVYNQLVSVREQIEVIKGQMNYYEQAAALSSIDVSITADEANRSLQIGGWEPAGVAKDAIEALFDTLQWLGNFAIWLALYMLPVGLIVYYPVRWVWRKFQAMRQRNKERRAAKKAAKEISKI